MKEDGQTLGNSLRRVLLSSLQGAGIVAIKIDGVDHEFDTISNIKEEVSEIILNLKEVRFKLNGVEEFTATLEKVQRVKSLLRTSLKTLTLTFLTETMSLPM